MHEFSFRGCIEIKELLGVKADDEVRLMELIEEVPIDSIYYHMHSYCLRHYYLVGPYPNDFANWVVIQVRDRVLGEKLGSLTPWKVKHLEDIRQELLEVIDTHLSQMQTVPSSKYGQPFHFMKSQIIEVPTGVSVSSLQEFRDALAVVDASAIYNHIFEARLRVRRGRSDFSIWLEEILGLKEIADKIEMIDSYMYSLEGLRGRLIGLCDEFLNRG